MSKPEIVRLTCVSWRQMTSMWWISASDVWCDVLLLTTPRRLAGLVSLGWCIRRGTRGEGNGMQITFPPFGWGTKTVHYRRKNANTRKGHFWRFISISQSPTIFHETWQHDWCWQENESTIFLEWFGGHQDLDQSENLDLNPRSLLVEQVEV